MYHWSEQQVERLARLIIGQTVRNIRYSTDRKERVTAPGGAVPSFLNATFQPKPLPSLVVEDSDGKRHNLITRENYGFLRDSFFRYAYLMEKEAGTYPGPDVRGRDRKAARGDG